MSISSSSFSIFCFLQLVVFSSARQAPHCQLLDRPSTTYNVNYGPLIQHSRQDAITTEMREPVTGDLYIDKHSPDILTRQHPGFFYHYYHTCKIWKSVNTNRKIAK